MRSIRAKRKFELLAACGIGLFAVGSLATATYAWFVVQHTASATLSEIKIEGKEYIQTITYHSINNIVTDADTGITTFNFNAAPGSPEIHEYSRADENPEHQLLIELTLGTNLGDLKTTANATDDILAGTHSWTSVGWSSLGGNPLSSIVTLAYYAQGEVTTSEGYISMSKKSDASTFITLADDVPSFTQNLTISDTIPNSATEFKVYYVLDYNVEAIESIYSANIGNPVFEDVDVVENGLSFACDFKIALEPAS